MRGQQDVLSVPAFLFGAVCCRLRAAEHREGWENEMDTIFSSIRISPRQRTGLSLLQMAPISVRNYASKCLQGCAPLAGGIPRHDRTYATLLWFYLLSRVCGWSTEKVSFLFWAHWPDEILLVPKDAGYKGPKSERTRSIPIEMQIKKVGRERKEKWSVDLAFRGWCKRCTLNNTLLRRQSWHAAPQS